MLKLFTYYNYLPIKFRQFNNNILIIAINLKYNIYY